MLRIATQQGADFIQSLILMNVSHMLYSKVWILFFILKKKIHAF